MKQVALYRELLPVEIVLITVLRANLFINTFQYSAVANSRVFWEGRWLDHILMWEVGYNSCIVPCTVLKSITALPMKNRHCWLLYIITLYLSSSLWGCVTRMYGRKIIVWADFWKVLSHLWCMSFKQSQTMFYEWVQSFISHFLLCSLNTGCRRDSVLLSSERDVWRTSQFMLLRREERPLLKIRKVLCGSHYSYR